MQKVTVPEGTSCNWSIEKFTISEHAAMMSSIRDGYRAVSPGEYTRLMHGNDIIMSDTNAEMIDHVEPVRKAKGNILINGLGIGMVLLNCMIKDNVNTATIIEKSEDVIRLVVPHYKDIFGDRIDIIHADAMTWKPPKNKRYGIVWHDIWPDINIDNYEQMKTLHRRYGHKCDWQGSWSRDIIKRMMRR